MTFPKRPRWLRSSFGQSALLMAATLLIAQIISFFLLVNERQRAGLVEATGPSLSHFVQVANVVASTPPDRRRERLRNERGFDRSFFIGDSNPAANLDPDEALKQRLSRLFASAPQKPIAYEAYSRRMRPGEPPMGFGWRMRTGLGAGSGPGDNWPALRMREFEEAREGLGAPSGQPPEPPSGAPRFFPTNPGFARGPQFSSPGSRAREMPEMREMVLAVRFSDGQWLIGTYRMQRPPTTFLWRLVGSALTIYVLVLAAALFIAYRLARPFTQLALAAEHVGRAETASPIAVQGPDDVRRAIEAFNAMASRVSRLLEEKDRFLGAIGHDLRTPIASMRIRAETLEPESERVRIVETLDEMTAMLEDILQLAQAGRSNEDVRPVDLSALADSIVEEFRGLGKDVTFQDSPRAPVSCRKNLTARILRNLVENAVKFGVRARVRVEKSASETMLIIDDDGPGIPEDELEHVRGAFVRLENSRNRETGGAGLGLSIATAIAQSQGASLVLENRPEGGLSARVSWPT